MNRVRKNFVTGTACTTYLELFISSECICLVVIAPELGPNFDGAWVLLTLFAVSVEYGSVGIGLSVKLVFPLSAQHLIA